MNKFIRVNRNEYIVNGDHREKCERMKMPYAAIQELNKFAYIRIDMDTLGTEIYDKVRDYINDNSIEVLDGLHNMVCSYLDYKNNDESDLCFTIGAFSWMKVRREIAPVIVTAIVDTLMDIVKNKI